MKICSVCTEEKIVEEFYRSSRNKSGRMAACKECQKTYPSRRASTSASRKGRQVRYRLKMRREALDTLGGRCIRCGIGDERVLQIDHIDGGGCQEQRMIGSHGVHKRVIEGVTGYQLLCANCHCIKTWHETSDKDSGGQDLTVLALLEAS